MCFNRIMNYKELFEQARTVAVVGISDKAERPARYVPEYLKAAGFRILGVHPSGKNSLAEKTAASLVDLGEPIDMVVLFRRSEDVPGHTDDILSLRPLPKTVWMQSGIHHQQTADKLREAGITVVSDRCTMVEHRATLSR